MYQITISMLQRIHASCQTASMASGVNMTCPDCKLNFPSMKVFLKHREKFCGKSDRNDASSERSHIKSVSVVFNLVKSTKKDIICLF